MNAVTPLQSSITTASSHQAEGLEDQAERFKEKFRRWRSSQPLSEDLINRLREQLEYLQDDAAMQELSCLVQPTYADYDRLLGDRRPFSAVKVAEGEPALTTYADEAQLKRAALARAWRKYPEHMYAAYRLAIRSTSRAQIFNILQQLDADLASEVRHEVLWSDPPTYFCYVDYVISAPQPDDTEDPKERMRPFHDRCLEARRRSREGREQTQVELYICTDNGLDPAFGIAGWEAIDSD